MEWGVVWNFVARNSSTFVGGIAIIVYATFKYIEIKQRTRSRYEYRNPARCPNKHCNGKCEPVANSGTWDNRVEVWQCQKCHKQYEFYLRRN